MTLNTEESTLDNTPPLNIGEQLCGIEGPLQLDKVCAAPVTPAISSRRSRMRPACFSFACFRSGSVQ